MGNRGGLFPFPTRNSPDPKASARDPGQQLTGEASGGAHCPRFSLRLPRFPPGVSRPHPSFALNPPPRPPPKPRTARSRRRASPRVHSPRSTAAALWRTPNSGGDGCGASPASASWARGAAAPAVPPGAERLGAGLFPAGARTHKHPHTDINARALTLTDAHTGMSEPQLDGGVQEG